MIQQKENHIRIVSRSYSALTALYGLFFHWRIIPAETRYSSVVYLRIIMVNMKLALFLANDQVAATNNKLEFVPTAAQ